MPFKRNPINAEKIDSLARALAQMPPVAWNNAAHTLLERTLDDSANRRTLLPEAFLISDEILKTATRILSGLNVNLKGIERNLETYAPFASTERVLMALVKAGADRQEMHEILRDRAMQAWTEVRQGRDNPLVEMLSSDPTLNLYLNQEEITRLMDVEGYTGIAPQRAKELAEKIRSAIETD